MKNKNTPQQTSAHNKDLSQSLAEFNWRKEIFLFLHFKNEQKPTPNYWRLYN